MTELATQAIAPSDHHPEGPSQWPAWAECPCFDGIKDIEDADIEALLPESKRGDDRAKGRGTAQHEALAKALTGQPDPFAGLSSIEEEQVRWVAETVVDGAEGSGYHRDELAVEQRLTMFKPDFTPLYFGTADAEYGPFIEDAKFGDVRNYFAQLCGYALAKMERDGFTRIYARLRYGRLRKTIFHVIDKDVAERVAYNILGKRANPHRHPKACSYCGWCKHRAVCPAINSKVDAVMAKREDWAIRLPTMHSSKAGADPVIMGAMRWLWKAYIEPWGEGVEHASNLMASCGNIPLGFDKRPEKGRLAAKSGTAVIDALEAKGLPLEAIHEAASFSMEALAKAYQTHFGTTEKSAKDKVEEILVTAGAAARGGSTFKLIRRSDAEDDIRAALSRPVLPLPSAEQETNLTGEQGRDDVKS